MDYISTLAVEYTPTLLATDLADASGVILGWVGAGVAGGVVLMFAYMGIRKGFAFFKSVAR